MVITLLDGEHELKPPTFYAFQLLEDLGVDLTSADFTKKNIASILAAFLTDSEPFENGEPVKVWTPTMAAKLMRPDDGVLVLEALTELIAEAYPETGGEEPDRPPTARTGSQSE